MLEELVVWVVLFALCFETCPFNDDAGSVGDFDSQLK
jgi:hypothetical protein